MQVTRAVSLFSIAASLLAGCGGGDGGGGGGAAPVTVSNLQYSPKTANATLGTITVSGSIDFSSGADLASLRITDSNGTNSTVPLSAPGLRSGRVTIPAANFRGNPVGSYTFSVWVRDMAGTESNKLNGQIEIRRVTPVAIAGPDATTYLNVPLPLDGRASTNVNGTATIYSWSITSLLGGANATLASPSTAATSLTCSAAGVFDVQLQVSDGTVQSAPDSLVVRCVPTGSFTLGSTEADVSRLTGAPNAISTPSTSYFQWTYSDSLTYVRFSVATRKVIGWSTYRVPLPVMMPFRATASAATKIAVGLTRDEVARIQGTPTAVVDRSEFSDYEQWEFGTEGLTYVRFSKATGLLIGYENYNGSLKI